MDVKQKNFWLKSLVPSENFTGAGLSDFLFLGGRNFGEDEFHGQNNILTYWYVGTFPFVELNSLNQHSLRQGPFM